MDRRDLIKALAAKTRLSERKVAVIVMETLASLPGLGASDDEAVHQDLSTQKPAAQHHHQQRSGRSGSVHLPAVAAHLVSELHDPLSGRLDAKRAAAYLDVPLKTLATAFGRDNSTVAKTSDSPRLQAVLAPVELIAAAFRGFPDPRGAMRQWLNGPHPDLGGKTPMSFILQGHGDGIADMIMDRQLGQPG